MEQFIKYLDSSLPSKAGDETLFKFKRLTLDEMNSRYAEVMQRGVTNQKVISDLIISEHPDLKSEYEKYRKKQDQKARDKRRAILNVVGSITYILCLIIFYLGFSFLTQAWAKTWLIVVDGILLWVVYLLSICVARITAMRRIFHVFARILLALDVVVASVAIFLFSLVMIGFEKSWVIVIAGIGAMFVADIIYVIKTKQRLAIIFALIYIPAIATMLYIVLAGVGAVAWNVGWLLIILSLIVDFAIIAISLGKNKHYKQEVLDSWQEN